ncbi:hypothetical protein PIB30_060268 [Stylosanthes scabra]|uniref:Uncharacterized protein n=1 Tax=Stylosanthes scabra TaxID=79078 RepID=A0ABU6SKH6_9FABA|nr:hypothetical protein [Stylosanthes scabra]
MNYWDTRVLVRLDQAEGIGAISFHDRATDKWFEVRGYLAPEFPLRNLGRSSPEKWTRDARGHLKRYSDAQRQQSLRVPQQDPCQNAPSPLEEQAQRLVPVNQCRLLWLAFPIQENFLDHTRISQHCMASNDCCWNGLECHGCSAHGRDFRGWLAMVLLQHQDMKDMVDGTSSWDLKAVRQLAHLPWVCLRKRQWRVGFHSSLWTQGS